MPAKPAVSTKGSDVPEKTYQGLRRFNLVMGFLHLIQGILMIVLSNDTTYPIYTNFLKFDLATRSLTPDPKLAFDLRFGPAVAVFGGAAVVGWVAGAEEDGWEGAVVPLLVVAEEGTLLWTEACQPISRTPAETAADAILALVLTVRTSQRGSGSGGRRRRWPRLGRHRSNGGVRR